MVCGTGKFVTLLNGSESRQGLAHFFLDCLSNQKAPPGRVAVGEAVSPQCQCDVVLRGLLAIVSGLCQKDRHMFSTKTEVVAVEEHREFRKKIWPRP